MSTSKAKALPAANLGLVQFTDEKDDIDPADSAMQIKLSSSDPDRAIIKLARPEALPDGHNVCMDMGRRFIKIAYWKNPSTIVIDKMPTELADVPAEKNLGVAKSKFLARNQKKVAAKNRVSITYLDKTYTAALRAQKLGGKRGLGEKKTKDLLPRVLCALTLHEIKEGKVNLILTIPFEGASDWATQEAMANEFGLRTWVYMMSPFGVLLSLRASMPRSSLGFPVRNLRTGKKLTTTFLTSDIKPS